MNYKISDVLGDIWRRLKSIIDNHLFMFFFFIFVVALGTCGIWIKPLLIDKVLSFDNFRNSFNTLALVSFCAPLLSVTIFDSVVRLSAKYGNESESINPTLLVWYAILIIPYFIILFVLLFLGARSLNDFSWLSFIAWVMALVYWALVNIENDAYKKPSNPSGATGTDDFDELMTGEQ